MCIHKEIVEKKVEYIQLVEQIIFKQGSSEFDMLDDLCFKSKNLYNASMYVSRQKFFADNEKMLNYEQIIKHFQETKNPDYYALNTKVAQWTVKFCSLAFKSFFNALAEYKVNPKKFTGRPKLPGYLDKTDGRYTAHFTIQAISKKHYKTTGRYKLAGVDNFDFASTVPYERVKMIRIVHHKDYIVAEVIYDKPVAEMIENGISAALDPGVTNFATIVYDTPGLKPFVVSGKYLKSVNNQYNKEIARLDSMLNKRTYKKETEEFNKAVEEKKRLEAEGKETKKITYKGKKSTKNKRKVTSKRNRRIKAALHKYSRFIVNQLVSNRVSTLFIGRNKNWKQDIKLSDQTNQNFVQIPYAQFFDMLVYKCKIVGIKVVLLNESYTSKCSFYDLEKICKHKDGSYAGSRIHRGLFRTKDGLLVNADVNGAYNILRRGLKVMNMDDSMFCKENIDKFKRHPKIYNVRLG